ncbi:hypothetical protein LINGRAPRIM_LOCUS2559 [Linum grandiflorum]
MLELVVATLPLAFRFKIPPQSLVMGHLLRVVRCSNPLLITRSIV